ncbi:RNA polymerase sigma factor [Limnoglobus roseus]|uniref:Uncharacterized protein n=1 Tax=Limnoglobus roseus TaxID=2598579 RepID=A0A5C1AJP9_9BACT|nr:hypothetical protein [Limnoglobus roseus]QEL19090.1 hypothetical protein PX52LOC_06147 [Limnoglobus roseus]
MNQGCEPETDAVADVPDDVRSAFIKLEATQEAVDQGYQEDLAVAPAGITAERLRQIQDFHSRHRRVLLIWPATMRKEKKYNALTDGLNPDEVTQALQEGLAWAAYLWENEGDAFSFAMGCCSNYVRKARSRKLAELNWRKGINKLFRKRRRKLIQEAGTDESLRLTWSSDPPAPLRKSKLLESLSERDREFLVLIYEGDLGPSEAARRTKTSCEYNTALRRKNRLLARLGRTLCESLQTVMSRPDSEWESHPIFRLLKNAYGREGAIDRIQESSLKSEAPDDSDDLDLSVETVAPPCH